MASNYVQLNWLEPSWDDDQVGSLSSLERRQRKAAEKQDVLAFYSSLSFLFFIITGLLVWSEIYAFATAPSRALTGAFLLEVWRSGGVAYTQLQNLYSHVGELAYLMNAVVYGPNLAERGVNITHGAAKLLSSGLYYLAVLLSGIIMYSTYPHVCHAPLRTAAFSTLAAGVLFGAPPLYALLISRLCQACKPQPVMLLALAFATVMILASVRMSSSICSRLAGCRKQTAAAGVGKQRNAGPAGRRQAPTGSVGGGASASAGISEAAAGGRGSGQGSWGHKRAGAPAAGVGGGSGGGGGAVSNGQTFSRVSSSSGRSANGGGGSTASGFDLTQLPPFASTARSPSNSSFAGSLSGVQGVGGSAAASAVGDPTLPAARCTGGGGGLGSGGSSAVDLHAAVAPGKSGLPSSRPGSTNHHVANGSSYDPVGLPGSSSSNAVPPSSSRAAAGGSSGAGTRVTATSGTRANGGNGMAQSSAKAASNNSNSTSAAKQNQQQRQQQATGGHAADGSQSSSGSSTVGSKSGRTGTAAAAASGASLAAPRTAAVDPVGTTGRPGGSLPSAGPASSPAPAPTAGSTKAPAPPSIAAPVTTAGFKKKTAGAGSLPAAGSGLGTTGAGNHSTRSSLPNGLSATASGGGGGGGGVAPAGPGTLASRHAFLPASAASTTTATSATSGLLSPPTAGKAKNGFTAASSCPGAVSSKPTATAAPAIPSAAATTAAPPAPVTTSGTSTSTSLLSRITASVAPALSGRGGKKPSGPPAAVAPRKQPPQQQLPQHPTSPPQPSSHQQQPLQYGIVPPPPPPPPRRSLAAADAALSAAATTAGTAASAAAASTSSSSQPVRNAWLNPNPVIKIASGVAKGAKGGAGVAGRPTAHLTATSGVAGSSAVVPPPPPPPQGSRSGGGAFLPTGTPPPPPYTVRSASCGGGLTAADAPVLSTRSSGAPAGAAAAAAAAGVLNACSSPSAVTDPVALPPPLGSPVTAAVGEPLCHGGAAVHGHGGAAMALGVPAGAVLPSGLVMHPHQHPPRLAHASGGGAATAAAEHMVSATIITNDPGIGPLVAHKHASGDLDIASAAADYRPCSSIHLPPITTAVVPAAVIGDVDSDSFSFFSTPPPVVISDPSLDPTAAAAVANGGGIDGSAPLNADAPTQLAGLPLMYGAYGTATFGSLSAFAADPVWSPNVPVPAPFFPSAATAGARPPRLPPPGFPSHAYGGAFATGPLPATAAWSHSNHPASPASVATGSPAAPAPAATAPMPPHTTTTAAAAAAAADIPPADALASLGFVDNDNLDSGSGGGEDAAGSCTICWSAPRQVGFLHGKTSHLCVCRRCAAQLREGVHRCPMCRQLIERIIDIF